MSKAYKTWIEKWIDTVAEGLATLTQRRVSSVERTAKAIAAAKERGVHLAEVIDDRRNLLVAASLHPFEPLC